MQSILTVFEAKTGTLMYQDRLGAAGEARASRSRRSPSATSSSSPTTRVRRSSCRPATTFKLLRVNELKARVIASPALVDGVWYWRTDRELLAIQ